MISKNGTDDYSLRYSFLNNINLKEDIVEYINITENENSKMRVRKKPDLRLNIPSYPHDYVEMPPETRQLIHDLSQTANDIKYIDEDAPDIPKITIGNGSTSFESGSELRSSTPEVKITSDENQKNEENNMEHKEISDIDSPDGGSPIIFRRDLKCTISEPDIITRTKKALEMHLNISVSSIIMLLILKFFYKVSKSSIYLFFLNL